MVIIIGTSFKYLKATCVYLDIEKMIRFILNRLGLTKEKNEAIVETIYNGDVDLVLTLGDNEAHRQFIMSLANTNGQKALVGQHKITVAIPNTKYSFSTYDYNLLGRIAYYMENKK